MEFYPEEATLEDVLGYLEAWFPIPEEPEPLEEGFFMI